MWERPAVVEQGVVQYVASVPLTSEGVQRLAWEYDRFFDERPKTTLEGPFYKFSYAILEQMDCDVVGLGKAITSVTAIRLLDLGMWKDIQV